MAFVIPFSSAPRTAKLMSGRVLLLAGMLSPWRLFGTFYEPTGSELIVVSGPVRYRIRTSLCMPSGWRLRDWGDSGQIDGLYLGVAAEL